MAEPHPRGHRPTDSPNTFTREWWEQEVRGLAFRDPRVFDQIAKGRHTFTVREIVEMRSRCNGASSQSKCARSTIPSARRASTTCRFR